MVWFWVWVWVWIKVRFTHPDPNPYGHSNTDPNADSDMDPDTGKVWRRQAQVSLGIGIGLGFGSTGSGWVCPSQPQSQCQSRCSPWCQWWPKLRRQIHDSSVKFSYYHTIEARGLKLGAHNPRMFLGRGGGVLGKCFLALYLGHAVNGLRSSRNELWRSAAFC